MVSAAHLLATVGVKSYNYVLSNDSYLFLAVVQEGTSSTLAVAELTEDPLLEKLPPEFLS